MREPAESARAFFAQIAASPDEAIDLAEAALAIAAEEEPGCDPIESLAILDALADQLRPQLSGTEELERLTILARYLRRDLGFRGNLEAYDDPRNSLLHRVLTRGVGIPLTLALVYIEVGRRVGVKLEGVAFPGHFLLRYCTRAGRTFYLDPFDPEHLMTAESCADLLASMTEGDGPFDPRYLEPATPRQILVRLLRNLKLAYFRAGSFDRAVDVIDRILLLEPACAYEYRDRGIAYLKLDEAGAAAANFERYLAGAGRADDRPAVQAAMRCLRAQLNVH